MFSLSGRSLRGRQYRVVQSCNGYVKEMYQNRAFRKSNTSHRDPWSLSFQFPAWRIVVARATFRLSPPSVMSSSPDAAAAACGSNLLPTHLVGELAAELGGYGATQSALAVGCVQHLGGCHV